MGGDGGVIASNRKFMRGAGTADQTGDLNRHAAQKFNAQEAMKTCALTKTPLHSATKISTIAIVADPYGRLYNKEAAIQALLKRKQQQQQHQQGGGGGGGDTSSSTSADTIGPQVRRLADLYDVRFHREENSTTPSCPIAGKALTGSIPAIVLVPGKNGMPNVVSESALQQLSSEELQEEYGIIDKRVRLAPDPILLGKIKERVQQEQDKDDEERSAKKAAKKKNKRKRDGKAKDNNNEKKNRSTDVIISNNNKNSKAMISSSSSSSGDKNSIRRKTGSSSVGQQIQSRVDSAIQQNSVLSSLFTNKNKLSKISEKEKKDNLFAR